MSCQPDFQHSSLQPSKERYGENTAYSIKCSQTNRIAFSPAILVNAELVFNIALRIPSAHDFCVISSRARARRFTAVS